MAAGADLARPGSDPARGRAGPTTPVVRDGRWRGSRSAPARRPSRRIPRRSPIITAGIDLAASPAATASAVVVWSGGGARLAGVRLGVEDGDLLDLVAGADRTGIDCPLGWPVAFIDFLNRQRRGAIELAEVDSVPDRTAIVYRRTDLVCWHGGDRPLSVAADRIAHPALRAAGLLSALAGRGLDVDRAGRGAVVETYPAAALRHWGLPSRAYKRAANGPARRELVRALLGAAPWLTVADDDRDLLIRSDDALDAVVCALVARASLLGAVTRPAPADVEIAAEEGWIAVPTGELSDLAR